LPGKAKGADPLLDLVEPERPRPPRAELVKGDVQAAGGAPREPPMTLSAARRQGLRGWLKVLGPGLITGASDDDPSGIGTYSQVGAQYGLNLLWMALFTFPLMTAIQELCARIALHTGVGLGVNLRRRFPTAVVGPAILAVVVANTINVGADLGAVAVGLSMLTRGVVPTRWLILPVALLILALQLFFSYDVIFRTFKYLTLALFAYVLTALLVHPGFLRLLAATVIPHVELSPDFLTAVTAVLGTTISPYLFFWQASSEVDEMKAAGQVTERQRRGTTTSQLRRVRFDTVLGMLLSQVVMYCIIVSTAGLHGGGGGIQTAQDAARALEPLAGPFAFVLFALGMIGTGMLAVPVLSGSAAYALKEFAGFKGGLAVHPRYRPTFYGVIVLSTLVGMAIDLVGVDPIKALFVTAVINGVVAPPLMVLIVILGSDRRIMGSRVSGRLSRLSNWAGTALMSLAALATLWLDLLHH
jgi:Mn2+/Fe2+ NRAMP family transporter